MISSNWQGCGDMIKEYAYAKVNLTLDVVGKRNDGYHDLKMIMIPIELSDELSFENADEIKLISNVDIPGNSVLKAAHLLQEKSGVRAGALITLDKKIPIGAGLAGGSADIAATLRGLNRLWNLNLELKDLEELALSLGSDTLFCLYNRPAYVFGRGEHLLFIHTPPFEKIILFPSKISVSTGLVFTHHQITHKPKQFDRLFRLYLNDRYHAFFKKTYNHLTPTTLKLYPELETSYGILKKISRYTLMSGSGSTFFIPVFKGMAHRIHQKLSHLKLEYIETKPKY
jgi:4-diphosphocytidyl-2-C-methyl-D-erythritol kinase